MDQLAYDLILYLHEPAICAVLARIVERVPGQAQPGTEHGILRCKIEEVVAGHIKLPTQLVSIPFSRQVDLPARVKASVNHWNALPLAAGDLLLLVCKPDTDSSTWHAVSGNQVASAEDPAVLGLKESYRIRELHRDTAALRAALESALVSPNALVRRYALDAICRHEVVPREVGCSLIVNALGAKDLDRQVLLRIADCLTSIPLFDEDQGADSVNRQVVIGVAAIVGRLTEPEDRLTGVRYLASCVLPEFDADPVKDRKVRSALLHAIASSPPKPIAEALVLMAGSDDPDDRETAEELSTAWKAPG